MMVIIFVYIMFNCCTLYLKQDTEQTYSGHLNQTKEPGIPCDLSNQFYI